MERLYFPFCFSLRSEIALVIEALDSERAVFQAANAALQAATCSDGVSLFRAEYWSRFTQAHQFLGTNVARNGRSTQDSESRFPWRPPDGRAADDGLGGDRAQGGS